MLEFLKLSVSCVVPSWCYNNFLSEIAVNSFFNLPYHILLHYQTNFYRIELHAGYIFTPQRWARDNMKHPPHIMSDHILLGSAVMGGCGCEATVSLIHLWCVCNHKYCVNMPNAECASIRVSSFCKPFVPCTLIGLPSLADAIFWPQLTVTYFRCVLHMQYCISLLLCFHEQIEIS